MSELRGVLEGIPSKWCDECPYNESSDCVAFINKSQLLCKYQIDQIIEAIKDLCWLKDELRDWMLQEIKRHRGTELGDCFEVVAVHLANHKGLT